MHINHIKCRYAAWRLSVLLSTALTPDLITACSEGLLDMAAHAKQYERLIITGSPFLYEIEEAVNSLCVGKRLTPFELQDIAFQLLEALTVVIREVVMRCYFETPRPAQQSVLRYFEHSGNWAHEEKTVVMDYYYTRVPIAVLQHP